MDEKILLNRIDKLKERMKNKGIDTALITKDENKFYLTNFRSSHFFVIITGSKNYLLTDFRYIELAKALEPLFSVVLITGESDELDFLKELKSCGVLGFEENGTTLHEFLNLKNLFGHEQLLEMDGELESLRMIKDGYEKTCIKEAAAIADDGFSHIVTFIQPGLTELEIALELEFYMRKNGGESVSFDVICASGQRSSLPHAVPGQRCIRKGDFIVLDFGCKVNGYCSDMTRTVAVGSVTEEQKKIYQLVYRAQMECLKQLHSGMRCSDFDKIARDLFIKEGYGAYFGHGLGHGVGLEIHEAPTANSRSKEVFQENMLITVEPGIYLEKKFGVRIEDLAIIEKRGIINLSNSTKELLIL